MSKKTKGRQPTMESAVKRELNSPLYRMRTFKSKCDYKRNAKHKNTDYHLNCTLESIIKMIVRIKLTLR